MFIYSEQNKDDGIEVICGIPDVDLALFQDVSCVDLSVARGRHALPAHTVAISVQTICTRGTKRGIVLQKYQWIRSIVDHHIEKLFMYRKSRVHDAPSRFQY